MPRPVTVSTTIQASLNEVWARVRDIESHVDWMEDAVEIRFLSDQREGPGTRFECDTRIGPFALTDKMEVTGWELERSMEVVHVGLVEGVGVFTLQPLANGHTKFRWQEDLYFPWFMGSRVGAALAHPIFQFIWTRNLGRLKNLVEQSV